MEWKNHMLLKNGVNNPSIKKEKKKLFTLKNKILYSLWTLLQPNLEKKDSKRRLFKQSSNIHSPIPMT